MNRIIDAIIFEGQAAKLRRRVLADDGTGLAVGGEEGLLVKRADVSTISYTVYDLDATDPTTAIAGPTTLVVSSTIYDTLQTDWELDDIGYNFEFTLPATVSATRGTHKIRVLPLVTLTGGAVFYLPFELYVTDLIP